MANNKDCALSEKTDHSKKRMSAAQKVAATAGAIVVLAPSADANADIIYKALRRRKRVEEKN